MRIYLIGFMGSGKTRHGKMLSGKTGMQFIDLDEMLIAQQQKSIAEIFTQHGEAYFRQLETEALHSTSAMENTIISCGGGTPCFNDNMNWILANGKCIYLTAPIEILFGRLRNRKEKRPLLKNFSDEELLRYIAQKVEERAPFYNRAHAIVDTSLNDKEENLIALLQQWNNQLR